eukprot:gnl/MRDRNA2_/MRDRNA2_32278_c0_seq2.p1 gnl/MRDRNA2_/MRDRNA2_32278_c0~~gnl/MRDRNA2_/MRDRNA2_32278_c0_seq2.p1  ORF type:complete len:563 (-),score=97.19 gnl/MRDRNA2_/MRDRNA2_32278_c0_seq2:27-1715(-)
MHMMIRRVLRAPYPVQHYFVKDGAGQATSQIDCLAAVGELVSNTNEGYWKMENGYCMPQSSGSIKRLSDLIKEDAQLTETLRSSLQVGVHWDTDVKGGTHRVCQVFSSALPVTYARETPSEDWRPFASAVLDATYEATLTAAAILAAQRSSRMKVFLTEVGGGAFGNDATWISAAIRRACLLFAAAPLDVQLVHRREVENRGLYDLTFCGPAVAVQSRIAGLPTLMLSPDFSWAKGPHKTCNYLLPTRQLIAGSYPGHRDKNDHIEKLRACVQGGHVDCFLCLQERDELRNRFNPYICDAKELRASLEFLHCPIPDGGVTTDGKILEAIAAIVERLQAGKSVYVHCWGGHGRTGSVLVALLVKAWGFSVDQAHRYFMAAHDVRESCDGGGQKFWPHGRAQYDQVVRIAKEDIELPKAASLEVLEIWEVEAATVRNTGSLPATLEQQLAALRAAGFHFPWNCPACSFLNENYPSVCEMCDTANAQYHEVRARMQAESSKPVSCAICLESPASPWSCPKNKQHIFCRGCVLAWLDTSQTSKCPGEGCTYNLYSWDIRRLRSESS